MNRARSHGDGTLDVSVEWATLRNDCTIMNETKRTIIGVPGTQRMNQT